MIKNILLTILLLSLTLVFIACGEDNTKTNPNNTNINNNGSSNQSSNLTSNNSDDNIESVDKKYEDPYTAPISSEILNAYKSKISEIGSKRGGDIKYDLIFLDDDNIPELVVTELGMRTALYTYVDGKVVYAMDDEEELGFSFGAGGNPGYDYLPRENVIKNFTQESMGLVIYTNYYKLDEKSHKIVKSNEKDLYETHYNDANGNGKPDGNELSKYVEEAKCFYGDEQISQVEFNYKQILGKYVEMAGTKSSSEILKLLEK